MEKNLGALGVFAGALLLTFIVSFRSTVDEPADFSFINDTEVQVLDPAKMTGQPEGRIAQAIFEGLTVYHPETLEALPGVAERWDVSDDGLVYTFHLRPDSYWMRGQERLRAVTAQDFIASWRRLFEPETASEYTYILYYIKGAEDYHKWVTDFAATLKDDATPKERAAHATARDVKYKELLGLEARDERTLLVTLKAPTPYFTSLTSFYPTYPVYMPVIEEHPRTWTEPGVIVTNGPFIMTSRRFNERIRLVRNEQYWDVANVGMETIDALAVEEITTALNLYLKGDVDWVSQLPLPLLPKLQPREDFHTTSNLIVYFYRINTTREPFTGPKGKLLRQALCLAIDREELIENVTKAGQAPAFSIVPQGIAGYTPIAGLDRGSFAANQARARELLVEAGFPEGKGMPTLELLYNTSEQHKLVAAKVQSYWAAIGVKVELVNQEWGTYLDSVQQKNYQIARAGWIGDYTDPNTFLDMWVTDGSQNNTGWTDPRYDRLIAYAANLRGTILNDPKAAFGRAQLLKDVPELAAEVERYAGMTDAAAQRKLGNALRFKVLRVADEVVAEELPFIPMYFYTTNQLWRPGLEGMYANLRDTHMPKFWRWADGAKRD